MVIHVTTSLSLHSWLRHGLANQDIYETIDEKQKEVSVFSDMDKCDRFDTEPVVNLLLLSSHQLHDHHLCDWGDGGG